MREQREVISTWSLGRPRKANIFICESLFNDVIDSQLVVQITSWLWMHDQVVSMMCSQGSSLAAFRCFSEYGSNE